MMKQQLLVNPFCKNWNRILRQFISISYPWRFTCLCANPLALPSIHVHYHSTWPFSRVKSSMTSYNWWCAMYALKNCNFYRAISSLWDCCRAGKWARWMRDSQLINRSVYKKDAKAIVIHRVLCCAVVLFIRWI